MKKPILTITDEVGIIKANKEEIFNNALIINEEGTFKRKEILFDSCRLEKIDFTKY